MKLLILEHEESDKFVGYECECCYVTKPATARPGSTGARISVIKAGLPVTALTVLTFTDDEWAAFVQQVEDADAGLRDPDPSSSFNKMGDGTDGQG